MAGTTSIVVPADHCDSSQVRAQGQAGVRRWGLLGWLALAAVAACSTSTQGATPTDALAGVAADTVADASSDAASASTDGGAAEAGSPRWGSETHDDGPFQNPDIVGQGPSDVPASGTKPDTAGPDTALEEYPWAPDTADACSTWTCNDDNDCTKDLCVPGEGCFHQPVASGTPCTDNTACTQGNTCAWGQCGSGALGPVLAGAGDEGHILALADGGALATGSKLWAPNAGAAWGKRLDSTGNTVWQVPWELGAGGRIGGSVALPNGGFAVVGTSALAASAPGVAAPQHPWAASLDGDGKVAWEKELDSVGLGGAATAVVGPGGDLWLMTQVLDSTYPCQVVRVAGDGALLGATKLGKPAVTAQGSAPWPMALAMAVEASGTVLVAGVSKEQAPGVTFDSAAHLWRLAADGSVIADLAFPLWKFGRFQALATDAGGWWTAGTRTGAAGHEPLITRFGADGQVKWRARLGDHGNLTSLQPLANGQVAALGALGGWADARLFRMAADGGLLGSVSATLSTGADHSLQQTAGGWTWTSRRFQDGQNHVLWMRADAWGHDSCSAAGACGDLKPALCPSGGPCMPASCLPNSGCAKVDLGCDDGSPCTADSCDPAQGCTHNAIANGAPCQDGNPCSKGDLCSDGTCTAPADVALCSDGNPCTVDTCMGDQGCAHAAAADGTACDDGVACTLGDSCSNGKCGYPGTWYRPLLSGKGGTILGLFATPQDGLAVVGTAGPSPGAELPVLVALDHGGQVLSEQGTGLLAGSASVRAAAQLGDGSVVAVGTHAGSLLVVRWNSLDTAGQVQTDSLGGTTLGDAVTPSDGGYLLGGRVGGQAFVQKRTAQGAAVWTQMLGVANAVQVDSLGTDQQGNLAASVALPMDLPGNNWVSTTVLGLDASGTKKWQMPMWSLGPLRLRVLRFAGAGWLAAGHTGSPEGFDADATAMPIDTAGKPQGATLFAQGGHVTDLAGNAGDWHAAVVHIGKQTSDWRGQIYTLTGTKWQWQTDLFASGQGTRMSLLRRNAGWDAAASGPATAGYAWQVIRTNASGGSQCP